MTPADRLHLADDALAACSEAPDTADLRPDLRARALAYAAAVAEVNGAAPKVDEVDALTRAQADLAAERASHGLAVSILRADGDGHNRRADGDATRPATVSPDDLLAEIEKVDDTGGQVWLSAVEIVLARHAGSVIGPVTTEATRPAPTPDATKVAGWAVMNGEFIDCVVEAKHKTAADEIAQKNRDRIAACPEPHMAATAKNVHVEPLYLAAPAPTPDASDEEDPTATTASLIAIAKDATAAPVDRWLAAVERWYRVDDYGTEEAVGLLVEAGDALVADENEAGARHVEHLAICQAEIDALRAEVARLTEARATVPAFDLPALEWRDEVDGSRTNVNGVSAFVTPAGPWTLSIFGGANNRIDGVTTVERAVSLLTGRAEAAPVDPDRTGEAAPRAVCPNHGDTVTCTCTTGALHCHACGHTPPLCDECDDDCIIDTGGGR